MGDPGIGVKNIKPNLNRKTFLGIKRVGLLLLIILIIFATAGTSTHPKVILGESGSASGTRLWSSGAELQTVSPEEEITGLSGTQTSACTTNTSTKRSGTASFRVNTTGSNSCIITEQFASSNQQAAYFARAYIRFASFPGTSSYVFYFTDSSDSNKIGVQFVTSSNVFALYNAQAGTQIGSSSSAISTNTWYRLELKVDTTTLASTSAEMRLDGASVASGTANLSSGVEKLLLGHATLTTSDIYYDDLALNDSTSRSDNWPGEGSIVYMRPDSDGDNTAWTASTGSDWATVDETPPNTNTDYIHSTTNGQLEDVNLQSASSAGIGSNDLIKLVQPGVDFYGCSTDVSSCDTGNTATFKTRIRASSGGTVEESASDTVTGGYGLNPGNPTTYQMTLYDLPGSSNTAWTAANLDATQVGINLVTKATADNRVTAMWLLVEYVPVSGGRLWSSGFELNTTSAAVEWQSVVGSPTIQTGTVRSGTYAMASAAAGAQSDLQYQFASANDLGAFFVRFYLNISQAESAEYAIFDLRSSTATTITSLRLTTSNTLKLYNSSTAIGSASSALSTNTWYRIELKMDGTPAGGSQVLEAKVNGTAFATSSSETFASGVTKMVLGNNIYATGGATTGQVYYDDVAINKGIGTYQNSYPGEGSIVVLHPNANGDNSAWTKNGAGCTGGSQYTCVSEVTPDDATTYLSATAADTISDENIENPSFSSSATINVIQVGGRFAGATSTEEDFRLRLKDSSNGVPIESNNLTQTSTSWNTNFVGQPKNYFLNSYTRPEQSSTWTTSDLNNVQIGIRDVNSTTGTIWVSTLWLSVDYTPPTISVSGTVFGTDESTADTSAPTVAVKVNGGGSYSSSASAVNGTYTVSSITTLPGDSLTIYLDGSTDKAATFDVSTGADMTGVNLYKDRASTRCDNSCSLTNTNIDYWDKDNDADIHAAVSSGNLTVDNDWKLRVAGSQTYAPGGTVTTSAGGSNSYSGDVGIASSGTLNMAGNALSIGGSYSNSGTYTPGSNTTTFTATGSGKTLAGTMTGSSSFYNITFDGSGGAWSFGSTSATATNNFTITTGTVTGSSGTITIGNNYSNSATFTHNSGTVTFNATDSGNTLGGTMTGSSSFYNLIFNGSGGAWTFGSNSATTANDFTITAGTVTGSSGTITIGSSYSNSGTFTHNSGTITMNATTSSKTLSGTMTGSSSFYNLIFNGSGGAWSFGSGATVANDLTITTGTVTAPSGTLTITGNYSNSAGFVNNGGTVLFNATDSGNTLSGTMTGSSGFATLTFNGSGGAWSFGANSATASNGFTITAGTVTAPSTTLTIGDNYSNSGTFTHNSGTVVFNAADSGNTLSGTMTSGSSFYNLTFNGSGGAWSFGANSATIANDFTITAGTVTAPSTTLTIGNSYSNSGTFTHNSGTVTFNATDSGNTLGGTMTGSSSFYNLIFNGSGGAWTFGANSATTANDFTITAGTVTAPSTTLTVGNSYSNSGTFTHNSGTVTFNATDSGNTLGGTMTGSSSFYNLTFNGSGGAWTFGANSATTANNFTITAGTVTGSSGTITIGNNYSNSGTFTHNSGTVTFNATDSGNTLSGTMTSGSSFYNLTFNGSGGAWSFGSNSATAANNFTITAGTVTAPSTTLTIGNNYSNSGTFTHNSGTVTLNATDAGNTLSGTMTSGSAFYDLTFNGSGGAWSFGANSATVSHDFTITTGTVTAPSTTLTINRNYSNSDTFTNNSGTVTLAGSSAQTLSGTMTSGSAFNNLTVTNSSGADASDCERTGFTASIAFGASATISNNFTVTTASSRIQYNSGSTYTITNINWNGQATGTKLYFRNSATSGTWLLNVSGIQTAVSYINVSRSDASGGNTIDATNGTVTDCNNNTNWNFATNTAPNSPTSLVQKKVTGGATLATGDWTNENQVTFTASADDSDGSDTLYLCVEKDQLGTGFSSTDGGDNCGSGVAYSGTPVTVSVTITGITDASEYHWQAQVKDAATTYSSWVSYGGNAESARDFGVDTTAPSTGTVNDGTGADATYNNGSLTSLSANWSGFNGNASGITEYDYSIGTSAGATDIKSWTSNSTSTSVTASGLVLKTNIPYYTNVRAVDAAGNTSSVVSSDGQRVLPQLSFSISSNTLSFANLNSSNSLQDTENLTLSTSTNAYNGYVVTAYAGGLLSSGSDTIPMFSAGSYASPATWGTGVCSGTSCGLGYTSSDTSIQGSNKFSTGTLFAPFTTLSPGDIVADHTANIDGSTGPVSNETFTITCKIAVSPLQQSKTYSGLIYFIATGTF